MLTHLTLFITILNPIALFLYLAPLREDLDEKVFLAVLLKATIISLMINLFFTFSGVYFFDNVLKIYFDSFRIFGGIVMISFALMSIIQGKKGFITIKGSLDDLASEIALPFLTGPGIISVCVIIGATATKINALLVNVLGLAFAYAVIVGLLYIRYHINSRRIKTAFDKLLTIFMRINGFILGAFGVDMIIKGLHNVIIIASGN
nr:MarC family protein [Limisalsivibrio acetivorans]